MKLSSDGKTLLMVYNCDIENGAFVIPEGVAIGWSAFYGCTGLTQLTLSEGVAIGWSAFYGCTGLTQLTLSEGVKIGESAFYGCTGLTQLTLSEGVAIGNQAFRGCTGLQQIVINTNNDEEIERIKDCLPEEYRSKVIKNPIYDNVVTFQKNAYQEIFHDPRLSDFSCYHDFFYNKLPFCLLSIIAGFESGTHQRIQKKVNALSFPTTPAAFHRYKIDFKNANPPQGNAEQKLSCIAKLQKYVNWIENKKTLKKESSPAFFNEHQALSLELKGRLDVLNKAIKYLKDDDGLSFTPAETNVLSQGFIGRVLSELFISLKPEAPQEVPSLEY